MILSGLGRLTRRPTNHKFQLQLSQITIGESMHSMLSMVLRTAVASVVTHLDLSEFGKYTPFVFLNYWFIFIDSYQSVRLTCFSSKLFTLLVQINRLIQTKYIQVKWMTILHSPEIWRLMFSVAQELWLLQSPLNANLTVQIAIVSSTVPVASSLERIFTLRWVNERVVWKALPMNIFSKGTSVESNFRKLLNAKLSEFQRRMCRTYSVDQKL